jgi:hypothetical protein
MRYATSRPSSTSRAVGLATLGERPGAGGRPSGCRSWRQICARGRGSASSSDPAPRTMPMAANSGWMRTRQSRTTMGRTPRGRACRARRCVDCASLRDRVRGTRSVDEARTHARATRMGATRRSGRCLLPNARRRRCGPRGRCRPEPHARHIQRWRCRPADDLGAEQHTCCNRWTSSSRATLALDPPADREILDRSRRLAPHRFERLSGWKPVVANSVVAGLADVARAINAARDQQRTRE